MSTLAQRQAAVSDAMEDVRTRRWHACVEWDQFEEGEMSYRVERDGRALVDEGGAQLTANVMSLTFRHVVDPGP